jgi:predicted NBD/HSP70 family sugar kinase
MRNLEESLFWEILYRHEAVRSELARLFGVSTATVSRSAGVLLSKGLIVETGSTAAHRGRRPNLLQINPQLACVGGIEIDRDRITAVVTDMNGNLLGRGALGASPRNSVAKTLRDCRSAFRAALADAALPMARVARIGVGHTGMLDVENGVCLNWEAVPHWRRVNLLDGLRQTFGKDVTLDDRARAIALALHMLWPEHRRHRSAIYVQIGTGIGAGIFVNGRMLRGATQAGGEIGHMTIERNGPLCACGRRGCVEAFASLGATLARVRHAMDAGEETSLHAMIDSPAALTADLIASAARQGDALAKAALHETGEALGIGIVNAVQLLNPSLVVLAGKFANAAREFLLDAVTRAIRRQCFENVSRGLEIRVAPLRKDVAPVGCALLASIDAAADLLQRTLFQPPDSLKTES